MLISGELVSWELISGKRIFVERISGKRIFVERISVERISGKRISGERIFVERISGKRILVELISGERIFVELISGKRILVEWISVGRILGKRIFGGGLCPPLILLASWGEVSDELCLELMRYDAFNHPAPSKFDEWANGGDCPYSGNIVRSAQFKEKRALWSPGPSKSAYELMVMLFKEKGVSVSCD